MEADEEYKSKLLAPLKDVAGVKISSYLSSLERIGVSVQSKGVVDEKFIAHFKQLVQAGLITNSSGQKTLESFGLEIGTNGHLIHWDCSDITAPPLVEHFQQVNNTINIGGSYRGNLQAGVSNEISGSQKRSIAQWLLDHIVATTTVGVLVSVIVTWLNIK